VQTVKQCMLAPVFRAVCIKGVNGFTAITVFLLPSRKGWVVLPIQLPLVCTRTCSSVCGHSCVYVPSLTRSRAWSGSFFLTSPRKLVLPTELLVQENWNLAISRIGSGIMTVLEREG